MNYNEFKRLILKANCIRCHKAATNFLYDNGIRLTATMNRELYYTRLQSLCRRG